MSDWGFLPPETNSSLPFERESVDVLVAWDGPQLMSYRLDNRIWLASRAEDSDQGVYWIEAPISPLALKAVRSGLQAIREALLSRETRVVLEGKNSWTVWPLPDPSVIPDIHLPDSEARLQAPLDSSFSQSTIVVDSSKSASRLTSFKFVSSFLDATDGLWNATYQAEYARPTRRGLVANRKAAELHLLQGLPGSLVVAFSTRDKEVESRVGARLFELLKGNEDDLISYVRGRNRVRAKLVDLLELLEKHDADLMARTTSGESVFVPHQRLAALKEVVARAKPTSVRTLKFVGYFEQFNANQSNFRFRDIASDEAFEGSLRLPGGNPPAVHVGSGAIYFVESEVRSYDRYDDEIIFTRLKVVRLKGMKAGASWADSATEGLDEDSLDELIDEDSD